MASNPMQRQARNSFLLGMVIAILIAGIIIVFLFMQMKNLSEENQKLISNRREVYVLSQDVKSGDVLTEEMFEKVEITTDYIPSDYVEIDSLLSAYSLYTKDGTRIISKYSNGEQHLYLDEGKEDGKNTEIIKDEDGEKYYKKGNGGANEYIETVEAPVIIKIDALKNTMITQSMIARSDEVASNDVRQVEYNTVVLPIDLFTGDYVDIRLMLPSGQNYIVLSKKRVTVPESNGEYLADTIQMNLSEAEILLMSSAIVENWMMNGASMLYATKYVEAGLQDEAIMTYVPSAETDSLLRKDPNIVARASAEIVNRYTSMENLRNDYINKDLSEYGSKDAISGKLDSSITSTIEARQEYLQSLVGE